MLGLCATVVKLRLEPLVLDLYDAIELRRLIHLHWPELHVTSRRSFAPVTRLRQFLILSGPILPHKPLRARMSSWSLPRSAFAKTWWTAKPNWHFLPAPFSEVVYPPVDTFLLAGCATNSPTKAGKNQAVFSMN